MKRSFSLLIDAFCAVFSSFIGASCYFITILMLYGFLAPQKLHALGILLGACCAAVVYFLLERMLRRLPGRYAAQDEVLARFLQTLDEPVLLTCTLNQFHGFCQSIFSVIVTQDVLYLLPEENSAVGTQALRKEQTEIRKTRRRNGLCICLPDGSRLVFKGQEASQIREALLENGWLIR